MKIENKSPFTWSPAWALALFVVLGIALYALFSYPILDGDPWWQMAYARYFFQNNTLIPDHGAFTWSQTLNTDVYCAWVGEIALYLVHSIGGVPALFILRFLCVAVLPFLVLRFAYKRGVLRHPLTWIACLLAVFLAQTSGEVKPQLFTFVLVCLATALWMSIKTADGEPWKRAYLFVLIMLVWVNTHGGFLVGLMIYGAIGAGELLNGLIAKKTALPRKTLCHLLAALALSYAMALVTPYGLKYPASLYTNLFVADYSLHFSVVPAYASVTSQPGKYYFIPYLVMALAMLGPLAAMALRARRFDWALGLVNALCVLLYVRYTRTTYFWAPVFAFTCVYWLPLKSSFFWPVSRKRRFAWGAAVLCLGLFLSGRTLWVGMTDPGPFRWLGYGVSHVNPVEEAAYIKKYFRDARVGNDYNIGGYLLWELGPDQKIFIDARYFPFREWPGIYLDFHKGKDVGEFVKNHPADLWCLGLGLQKPLAWFIQSEDWKPVYYGPSAAVFVPSGTPVPKDAPLAGKGLDDIKNIKDALGAFLFAVNIRDITGAVRIVRDMEKRFDKTESQREVVKGCAILVNGVAAYYQGKYDRAAVLLVEAKNRQLFYSTDILFDALTQVGSACWGQNRDGDAEKSIKLAFSLKPKSYMAAYNAGVVSWYVRKGGDTAFRAPLEDFLELTNDYEQHFRISRAVARDILDGKFDQKPPLMLPPDPRPLYR